MRVVFVNRFFHPDLSATSQMVSDLAFHLAARGWDVGVVTSRQLYDDSRASLPRSERIRGVEVRRIATTRFGRAILLLRAIDYLTFYVSSFFALLRERQSIVVALTDPPLVSVVASLASRRVVNWVQDVFPEVAHVLGVPAPALLTRVRDWSLRRARMNVAIGERIATRLAGRTTVRHNWAADDLKPVARTPESPFTIAYSGNLGRAHDFDAIIDAMHALPDVRFVITGGGARSAEVRRRSPANVEFREPVRRDQLSVAMGEADAHLVTLQPALEGLIVPSKFYGILAAGRAALHVGDPAGEIGQWITREQCGFVVRPDDSAALIEAIRRLERDRALCAEMGRRARTLYEREFSPDVAFAQWEGILGSIANG